MFQVVSVVLVETSVYLNDITFFNTWKWTKFPQQKYVYIL